MGLSNGIAESGNACYRSASSMQMRSRIAYTKLFITVREIRVMVPVKSNSAGDMSDVSQNQ